MEQAPFFWLHIKKSAGITTRALLQPYYVEVDRTLKPANFIQASPAEYNDILNNYRVVLGEYQFKRALFAKKFLFPDTWDNLFSFAFSREPVDRCVSMFHYLFWKNNSNLKTVELILKNSIRHKKLIINSSYAFDCFLDLIEETKASDSIYSPMGLHFSTHTADMWGDISDEHGQLLLTKVYRLEDLAQGINQVFEMCKIDKCIEQNTTRLNTTQKNNVYEPKAEQRRKIEMLFTKDFELYESAIFQGM